MWGHRGPCAASRNTQDHSFRTLSGTAQMNPVAVQNKQFPVKARCLRQESSAIVHDSYIAGIFDSRNSPKNGISARRVHVPAGRTSDIAAVREMLGAKFYHHMALPAVDRVTEFGNLLVRSINALVKSPIRDRFSFSLKLCSACIVDSQQD